jgi:hypothetical protein
MSHKYAKVAIILAIIVLLAFAAPALGKGKPTTEATNNLSVPTIMLAGGSFTGVTVGVGTPSPLVPPTGTPLAGYPISPLDYYYVQGVHKWQAQAYSTTSVPEVTAAWGDNLSGDAKLKTNSPIRVELGLFHTLTATDPVPDPLNPALAGYTVVKLDPAALDRESAYGTLATSDGAGGFSATPTSFTTVRVFDNAVTFSIQNLASGVYVVQPGTKATAEINATGNVVYGYNLRVSVAGDYVITYIAPSVTITGADAGTFTANSVTLNITVSGGGGGGGGGHRP